MRSAAAFALALCIGEVPAIAWGQTAVSEVEEHGPPHESLGRAAEQVHAVFCKLPDREELESQFHRDFQQRYSAVHKAVEDEFGKDAANRSYISVLPCRRYRSEFKQDLVIASAIKTYERELERWEARYHLGRFRKGN